jgi:VIT1/CCC1 family predicted Fe2+/Mn2+ transporter
MDRFVIRNKFFFFTGAAIFVASTYYSIAKNNNSMPMLSVTVVGIILMLFGFKKPKEK